MVFKVKPCKGMDERPQIGEAVARKLNGYIVLHNGEEVFICSDDIEILSIKNEEKKAPIRW